LGVFLAAGGALMAFADFWYARGKEKKMMLASQGAGSEETITDKEFQKESYYFNIYEVLVIGMFQALAIFPGVSRSGATLSGALLLANNRAKSVRFSFLLSIPAIGLSSLYDFVKILTSDSNFGLFPDSINWTSNEILLSAISLIIAVSIAYFSGLFFLKWLLKYLGKNQATVFVWYRIALALVVIVLSSAALY
jgi:undecaprenyl-diphosphatase